MNSNYDQLIEKLNEFIRKYYFNKLTKGLIYFFSLVVTLFLCLVFLEYYGEFNSLVRSVLFYSFSAFTLLIFIPYIFIPLLKIFSFGKVISHQQAAEIIGKHFPNDVGDKLLNILQLRKIDKVYSAELLEASINQKIDSIRLIPFKTAINLYENKRYLRYLIPSLAVVLCTLLFFPSIISEGTSRLVAHQTEFLKKAPFQFIILNQKLEGFKNEDYTIKVEVKGKVVPASLYLKMNDQTFLMNNFDKSSFSYLLNNLQKDLSISFIGNQFESKVYTIKVLPKPLIVDFETQISYPDYLNLKQKTVRNIGDLTVPIGTEISWIFTTSDTKELELMFEDSSYLALSKAENLFTYSSRFFKSSQYTLSTSNQLMEEKEEIQYQIEVVPDHFPEIEVDLAQDSTDLNLYYFSGLVSDDHGFNRLVFHYKTGDKEGKRSEEKEELIPINKTSNQTAFFHPWNLKNLALKAGDKVEYYFEIWDNDGVNGSKPTRTVVAEIAAPTKEALVEKEKEDNEKIKDQLKESIRLAKEIRNDIEDLNKKLIDKKTLGFQEQKQVESILEKQKQVKESVDKIKHENEKKNNFQKSYTEIDEELLEKQKQLEDLFEKIMSDEMKELMKELEEMMQNLNKNNLQEALEKMDLNNEVLEKELDRNLELFKRLELEKQIEDAKSQLNDIKEKQDDLIAETKEKEKSEELKNKQDDLSKEFEDLEHSLEEIKEKNKELEEPLKMEETKELEEKIKEDMKESSDELAKKNMKKSKESQENAKEKLEELSEQMDGLQMQMQSGPSPENYENLRALLENLIQLSFDQEFVMEELKKTEMNDPKYVQLSQDQKKLKDNSQIIQDSLFALSKRVMQIEAIVNKEIVKINYNMDKALEEMHERRTGLAGNRQQLTMTSINNLALLLDESLQKMQQQGNGSCSKPGSGKPSSSNMKKMQESLNKQMEAMKKAMEKGEKPGGEQKGNSPGKKGQPGMSQSLAKMAAKQAAIREALQKMQESLNEGEQGSGGLKKLSELMEKTETDLVNKTISNQTILRQQEILTRLLESEKAEKEREKEEKRESKEFTNEYIRNPNEFLEYNKLKEKEIELLRTLPPSFNPYYKLKVNEYFYHLKE